MAKTITSPRTQHRIIIVVVVFPMMDCYLLYLLCQILSVSFAILQLSTPPAVRESTTLPSLEKQESSALPKCFGLKFHGIKFPTKNSVYAHLYLPQELSNADVNLPAMTTKWLSF